MGLKSSHSKNVSCIIGLYELWTFSFNSFFSMCNSKHKDRVEWVIVCMCVCVTTVSTGKILRFITTLIIIIIKNYLWCPISKSSDCLQRHKDTLISSHARTHARTPTGTLARTHTNTHTRTRSHSLSHSLSLYLTHTHTYTHTHTSHTCTHARTHIAHMHARTHARTYQWCHFNYYQLSLFLRGGPAACGRGSELRACGGSVPGPVGPCGRLPLDQH